jgi:RNA polymerase sigma-70 factor (ECF subfamily)
MLGAGMNVEALYERYGPMVLRRCRYLLRDEDEALDVMQDVFMNVIKQGERFEAPYPSSLLYRIATNLSLNRIRDRKREPSRSGEGDEMLHAIACAPDQDAPLLLRWLFGNHPESTRTMAVLHYVDGMTLEQVATECGLSVSGVRKRLRGLRMTLRAAEGR